MTMLKRAVLATGFLMGGPLAAQTTVTTFDNGGEGWDGAGSIEADGGNPGANFHFFNNDFGIEIRNDGNPAFAGDMTTSGEITVGTDVLVNSIQFEGTEVSRELIVEFRSHALAPENYPYAAVWYDLGPIQANPAWNTFAVTVAPNSIELPAGWGGYGAEDANAEPILPPGVTFADVMANVDELAFTTLEPGYFYGFTDFDVRFDNLFIDRAIDTDTVFANGFELQ